MAVLTDSYQYIGRTNAVSCSAGWNYYILLYAKTSGSMTTGKHTVTVLMRLACTSNSTFYGYGTDGYVKVGDTKAISWSNSSKPGVDWRNSPSITVGGVTYSKYVDLGEGSVEVNTGWGIEKDIKISTSWGRVESVSEVPAWLPYYKTYATAEIAVSLPMIVGASVISSADDVILGKACCVRWTPIGKNLRYKLRFSLGEWSHTTDVIHPNTTSLYGYTGYVIPLSVAEQIPDSPTGEMSVTLYTYSDDGGTSQVGSAASGKFTVTVPNDETTQPWVEFEWLGPINDLKYPLGAEYIKGKTKVGVTIYAYGMYGASVEAVSFTVDGKTYNGDTSDYLSTAGTLKVTATAKDSRGYIGSCSVDITVHDYAKPTVQVSVCTRSDADGNLSDTGTGLKIEAQSSCFPVGGHNSCRMWYRWKLATAPDSGFSDPVTLTEEDSYNGVITDVEFSNQVSYVVQIGVTDGVGETATAAFTILTEQIYWHRGAAFLALGMYSQAGGLECGWPARFYDQVFIGDVTLENYIKNLISGGG